jgi:hypothetical protein
VLDSSGEMVPSQISKDANGNNWLHFEAEVSGMGYATFALKKDAGERVDRVTEHHSSEPLLIETDFYSAIFDPSRG